jgi:hypothetical protein
MAIGKINSKEESASLHGDDFAFDVNLPTLATLLGRTKLDSNNSMHHF